MAKKLGKAAKKAKLSAIFGEMQDNPPAILAKTAAKKGAAQANKQRVAIAMSKAGMSKKKNSKMC